MVACHLPRDNLKLMLAGNPPNDMAHTKSDVRSQHRLPILRNPHHVDLEVAPRVRSQPIVSHATKLHEPTVRPKARGFNHPRWGLLI